MERSRSHNDSQRQFGKLRGTHDWSARQRFEQGENLKIVFEFIGGPYDGKILHGALGEPSDAERYFLFSNRGAIGYRFKVVSDYAVETLAVEQLQEERRHHFQPHHYMVVKRFENEEEVRVLAKYENS